MPEENIPAFSSDRAKDILDGLSASSRIGEDEARILAREAGIHDLCKAAMENRLHRFGRKAFYVYNQHVNFTNICVNACRFCAFSKRPGDEGAYAYTVDQIREKIRERINEPILEIHVVGGLNPELPLSYYVDILKAIREERPKAIIKAFTAVEAAHLSDVNSLPEEEILGRLKEAGLSMLPGGGAEVFSPELRKKLCPEKVTGERWLSIHAKAHGLGLLTNATMLFGHIESWEERIGHMAALRDLQDVTGGFRCFIPLAYQPGNNPLGASGPDGQTYLRVMALSRLFLDNIPHLKAYWVYAGIKAAQMALWAGADDFDGTLVEEKIGHAAGADTPKGMTTDQLRKSIAAAGFEPVERDARFGLV